jgi:hypothetical protein
MKNLKYLLIVFGLFLLCPQAEAQTSRNPCYTTGALTTQGIPNCIGVGTSTPLPTTATSSDYTTTSPGTSAPLGVPVQGMAGGVPIGSPDAGNIAGGSGAGTCTASCNATTLWQVDTSGYSEVTAQTTAAGSATTTFQESNDGVNWLTKTCYSQTSTFTGQSNAIVTTNAATGLISCPVTARYLRSQFTAYTSGTRTDFWVARKNPTLPIPTVFVGNSDATTPPGATALAGNASGSTGAVVGTLAAAASVTTYICGFNVSAIGGTAPVGPIVVAGLIGSSQTYQGSASAAGGIVASQTFFPCIPASAANTAITITTTADGTATAVNVNAWGFRL